jgi:creatinine amidohydrolase/Fe(II)-dependent formamide hydrolase-like protein
MKGSLLALGAALLGFAFDASAAPLGPAPVMMERMTTAEIRDAIKGGKTIVLIYNASTEATGPAIALGKHLIRARYLGEHIARDLANALVAPVMPFAPTTDESRFPGTINLCGDLRTRRETSLFVA